MKPLSLLVVASAFAVVAMGVEVTMKFGFRGLAHAGGFTAALLFLVASVTAFLNEHKDK